jgi:Flp pilus assembly protein TadB
MTARGERRLIAYILIISGAALIVWGALAGSTAIILLDVPAGVLFVASGFWLLRRNTRRRHKKMDYD